MGTGEGGVVGTDVGWAENVGSAEGGVVGVDVGRFVAVVGSRDGIDVGVDVGTFVGADSGDVGNIEQAQHWELSEQYATFRLRVTQ